MYKPISLFYKPNREIRVIYRLQYYYFVYIILSLSTLHNINSLFFRFSFLNYVKEQCVSSANALSR